ncbi:uncharacterized protein LOC113214384 [Frankliniella occidentalis]|uniref:Uncharacterized protein LOC113214384 n=1 Tax=Frankliniella occidentalis TaxID=133901 RepID=A0A9C6X4P6_FRAOC|nr:uncharacterized protein LOC113214384 [Frankliniella occidentalis]
MHHHVTPLFPSVQDVEPGARNVHLQRLKEMGPYGSMQELLQLHIDLISEDYLCALHDQLNTLRLNPELLDTPDHYEIRGDAERFLTRGRFQHPMGIEFHFDASLYSEVEWDEEKRLMRNNLVFLTDNNLQDFVVGLIHASGQKLLQKGCIIIKIIKGFDDRGYPVLDDQAPFIGKTWRMVESSQFHFPFLQVTNILRKEIGMVTLRNSFGMAFEFYDEIVYGIVQPAKEPRYTSEMETLQIRRLRRDMRDELNSSQYTALKKVLKQRVALVQGPPGTGKTYLGGKCVRTALVTDTGVKPLHEFVSGCGVHAFCTGSVLSDAVHAKVAQLLVSLKRLYPNVLSGPILVVAMSNHAVQEFLVRCKAFSDKIIHCCSDKHDRGGTQYGDLQKLHDQSHPRDKAAVMASAEIIGMTTTRASCVRTDLDRLEVKIVIVEEAAEALECHILAAIPIGAQHLIQIGDHRQLRPICAHEGLARTYNLDLSLFERLVNNGADVPMLSEQRRMRPCIADLVRIIYPNLTDHACTLRRPRVRGVDAGDPVFFMNHGNVEKKESKGYSNRAEAEIAVELANYLVVQGYDVEKITILTTYRKQLRIILQLIGEEEEDGPKKVRATTVDSFQGEENTIIILSFVRFNLTGEIGFLKMANRACVALSRARDGFFMLGNLECLASSQVPVWKHVKAVLTKAGRCGPTLPLVCPHGRRFEVESAADVRAAARGCQICVLEERFGSKLSVT